jgi:hypothetical protein
VKHIAEIEAPDIILAPGETESEWIGEAPVFLEARSRWLQAERRVGWDACLRALKSQESEEAEEARVLARLRVTTRKPEKP